jgi:hypothetical protein
VRVGDTVRRPLTPDSERIHRLLRHFESCGFDGAPRFLGIDARRREILSFIDGFAPPHNGFIFRDMILVAIIHWDTTRSGTRLADFGDFPRAFVHPAVYGDGEPAGQRHRWSLHAVPGATAGLGDRATR